MSARRAFILVICLAALAGLVGWWFVDAPRRAAARAVRAYDVALSQAVRALDPELMTPVSTEDEKQRVASYVTLLWGRQIALQATLESLDVTHIERSSDTTIVAQVAEVWSYQDLDAESGKAVGDPRRESMQLRYTLVRRTEQWIVGRSALLSSSDASGARE